MQAEQLGCAMHEVEEKEHKADLLWEKNWLISQADKRTGRKAQAVGATYQEEVGWLQPAAGGSTTRERGRRFVRRDKVRQIRTIIDCSTFFCFGKRRCKATRNLNPNKSYCFLLCCRNL
jgi:hypothetical protein